MGGITRANWAIFEGGPWDGQRHIMPPFPPDGAITCYTDAAPGMRTPHVYAVSGEYRTVPNPPWKSRCRVLRFVRTLPDEPVPPPVKRDFYGNPVVAPST